MGGSSLGYLMREGARNIYANKQMSAAAIGVLVACLLLIGASILFSFNANSFVGYVEAQNEVVVFLTDGLGDEAIDAVEQSILDTENVAGCRFISKEEGLDSWVNSMSGVTENSEELFAPLYEDNIMPDSFSVTVRDLSQLDATVEALGAIADVDYVRAPEQVAQTITILKNAVNVGGAAIVLLLIAVASMIIANTIKITVFNRRKEISIMKYVGATDMFIRLPFIVEGLLLGLISATLAFLVIWALYALLCHSLTGSDTVLLAFLTENLVPFGQMALPLIGCFILVGVTIGTLGSIIFVRRYLKV